MKYMKQIMGEIHKTNMVFPRQTICLSQTMLDAYTQLSKSYASEEVDYYTGLQAGVYLVGLNLKKFIFYLTSDLLPTETLSIANDLCFHIINTSTGQKIRPVPSYEIYTTAMKNGVYELTTTVNSLVCNIIVHGETVIRNLESVVSPLHPSTFTSVRDITIQSSPNLEGLDASASKIVCNSPFYLNSLPNGTRDYLIMNGASSFIINKVGRIKLTGNEMWEKIDNLSTSTYSIFFLEYDLAKKEDGPNAICSTHFPNTSYASLAGGITTPNGIACADSTCEKHGIYIMIANSYMEGRDTNAFKNYLRNAYRTDNPVTILHEMADTKIKNITVNDYQLQTFFPRTIYKTNYPSNVALCANFVYSKEGV